MARQTESGKKPKKKKEKPTKRDKWMGFYNGRIPKKLVQTKPKRPAVVSKKDVIHKCPFCYNKSNEGEGGFTSDDIWVCSPCIAKHAIETIENEALDAVATDDDNEENGFQPLTPWEIERHGRRQKDKNLWLFLFGVIIIAIILSLVERSRIFSVIAVVALIAVFLLYRYEVKI